MTGAGTRTLLVLLHGLGCSARTWDDLVARLDSEFDILALDLPGHGADVANTALTVEQMAAFVTSQIESRHPARWAIAGHSMGGKIATIVAGQAELGRSALLPPSALILVAASPLTPEPMDGATRTRMIDWCAAGSVSEAHAREFVLANLAGKLPSDRMTKAVADVTRVNRTAWLAWLERGSLEDWSGTVGEVLTPALVIAGAEDAALGPDAQRSLVLPRVGATHVTTVSGAAHLIMLEQPARLAGLISDHVLGVLASLERLPSHFAGLLGSDRVSARTRAVLLQRLAVPRVEAPVFDERQRAVLEALVRRVVPQRGTDIDIAAVIESALSAGEGDGWRFAELSGDVEAWRRGLDTLDALAGGFVGLAPDAMDDLIARMTAGEVGSTEPDRLTDHQMTLWFEDVRAEAVRAWISHPEAMARIGYDGFANGGDGVRKQGYLRVSPDQRERWQPPVPATSTTEPRA